MIYEGPLLHASTGDDGSMSAKITETGIEAAKYITEEFKNGKNIEEIAAEFNWTPMELRIFMALASASGV